MRVYEPRVMDIAFLEAMKVIKKDVDGRFTLVSKRPKPKTNVYGNKRKMLSISCDEALHKKIRILEKKVDDMDKRMKWTSQSIKWIGTAMEAYFQLKGLHPGSEFPDYPQSENEVGTSKVTSKSKSVQSSAPNDNQRAKESVEERKRKEKGKVVIIESESEKEEAPEYGTEEEPMEDEFESDH